jgi:hypothetical protein
MDICGTAREANALFLGLILALVEEYHNIVAQVANLRQPLCLSADRSLNDERCHRHDSCVMNKKLTPQKKGRKIRKVYSAQLIT